LLLTLINYRPFLIKNSVFNADSRTMSVHKKSQDRRSFRRYKKIML